MTRLESTSTPISCALAASVAGDACRRHSEAQLRGGSERAAERYKTKLLAQSESTALREHAVWRALSADRELLY